MVRRLIVIAVVVCAGLTAGADVAVAQRSTTASAAAVPLKVTIVISRHRGDKQTSRLPFELWVNAGEESSLRVMSTVPVPQTTFAAQDGKSVPTTSYQYREIGTSITCRVHDLSDGRFRFDIGIDDSQLPELKASVPGGATLPSFQAFRATTQPLLRDGQTVQHSLATDKVTGELVKVEITASVIK
jgi:hypothetical protein